MDNWVNWRARGARVDVAKVDTLYTFQIWFGFDSDLDWEVKNRLEIAIPSRFNLDLDKEVKNKLEFDSIRLELEISSDTDA